MFKFEKHYSMKKLTTFLIFLFLFVGSVAYGQDINNDIQIGSDFLMADEKPISERFTIRGSAGTVGISFNSTNDSTNYKSYISLKEKILIDKDKEGISKVQYHRYEGIVSLLDYLISEEIRKFQLEKR